MKREEVFLRQHAIQVAIMCVEAMHADSTTLNPVQEADHFNIMQPLYRILGELDAEAHDFAGTCKASPSRGGRTRTKPQPAGFFGKRCGDG